MKKKIYSILAAATLCMGAAAQSVTVEDVEALSSGETVTFNIHYSDVSGMTSTHFEVNLPTGFSVDKVEATSDWSALFSHEGGVVSGMSTSANAFSGEGDIASMTVTIPTGTEVGAYPVSITNVRINGADLGSEPSFTINVVTAHTVVLDENSTEAPSEAEDVNVRVQRTINAGEWTTICLPFAMTEEQCKAAFGDDVQIADFNDYDYDDEADALTVAFTAATAIEANHPYIIKVGQTVTEFAVAGVDIDPQEAVVDFDTDRRHRYPRRFVGVYEAGTVLDWGMLFLSGNQFWYSVGETKMKAYRAYFHFDDVLASFDEDYASRIAFNFGGEATGISQVEDGSRKIENGVYDLQGRRMAWRAGTGPAPTGLKKGIYVKEGKKVIIK